MSQSRLKRLYFLVVFVLVVNGCARAPSARIPDITDVSFRHDHMEDLCRYYDIRLSIDSVTQAITLNQSDLEARMLVGSPVVLFGEERVSLGSPVKRVQNAIIVPPDFKQKVIDRFGKKVSYAIKKFKKIVLDAGHGGKDPGAIGKSGTEEKTVVLDIAKRLQKDLAKNGIEVIMTRHDDTFIPLPERTQIANSSKADLFISIHANASSSRNVKGMEVYHLRELNWSEKKDEQLKENRKTHFKQLAMQHDLPDLEEVLFDMLYVYKQDESEKLAKHVSDQSAHDIKSYNRGNKTSAFFVLRNTMIPAILVEVGFLSNPTEEKLLKSSDYRQELADSLAKSIIDYANKSE